MRKIKVSFIILLLSVILVQFQNCGSPPEGSDEVYSSSNDDMTPGLVDDLPNRKLAFVESLVVSKHDADVINYDGLCSRDSHDQTVEWVVVDLKNDDEVIAGETKCIRGGFRISVQNMLDLECGVDYKLIPYIDENSDDVLIRRKCEPISSFKVQAVSQKANYNNPNIIKKSCYYELEQTNSPTGRECFKTCYMSYKLYERSQISVNFCESSK